MEAAAFNPGTMPTILCCMCGTAIPPNPSNMCVGCIRSQVDITEGIPKQLNIFYCRNCNRYLQPPKYWVAADLESKELLALCLKRMRGLNKVKLVDAGFIWTEPHSKRIKVKLTIQKEVFNGTILQQVFVVEFIVDAQQCDNCKQILSEKTWKAVCQVRQKVDHKRTFLYLEQLILKHGAHQNTVNIKECPDGIDFFFANRSQAMKFLDFLHTAVPIRYKASEHLISHDANSNTYNYQYSFSVEIAPVCKDDLVVLPPKISGQFGGLGPAVLCTRIGNMIQIMDPRTLQTFDIAGSIYWKSIPFQPLASVKAMVSYTVLDIEPIWDTTRGKWVLADAQVVKTSELGQPDRAVFIRTHLGHLLKPGDTALGYDLQGSNFNDADLHGYRAQQLPDVVLVRKDYGERRRKGRKWKLRHLEKEEEEAAGARRGGEGRRAAEYEAFLRDLEEDPELRKDILIYKDPAALAAPAPMSDAGGHDEDGPPEVGLEEMLDGLTIRDAGPDAGDADEDEDTEMAD